MIAWNLTSISWTPDTGAGDASQPGDTGYLLYLSFARRQEMEAKRIQTGRERWRNGWLTGNSGHGFFMISKCMSITIFSHW